MVSELVSRHRLASNLKLRLVDKIGVKPALTLDDVYSVIDEVMR